MKILLLGEFSGLHKNLKAGLVRGGHKVDLVSSGDGFKKIYGDIVPPLFTGGRLLDKLAYRLEYHRFLHGLSGYDVVQVINPSVFALTIFPVRYLIDCLKKNNGKIFLLAAGSDAYYWKYARNRLAYGPFDDVEAYDQPHASNDFLDGSYAFANRYLASVVDGIIPIAYDYWIGYRDHPCIRSCIPMPIDICNIIPMPFVQDAKVRFIHGVSRYGFKGTRHIEEAFNRAEDGYCDKIYCETTQRLPLETYLAKLKEFDVVVDQVNSYSYGMNALYSMALGKVVISGCEPECTRALNILDCPVWNARPNSDDVLSAILDVAAHKDIRELASESRLFVEKFHNADLVASLFVAEWCS